MEAFLAEPWWYIGGILFFCLVVIPVSTVYFLFKCLELFRDWWNDK